MLSRSYALPAGVFVNTLCWALAYAVLPFYVHQLAPASSETALQWRGWIIGVTPLLTIVSMPIWIRLCRGRDPYGSFLLASILQGACFVLTAAASSLRMILVSRILLGFSGPALTFAFMAAQRRERGEIRALVAAMQSAITFGLVFGPFVGTALATLFGYQATFGLASVMLVACGALVRRGSTLWRVIPEPRHTDAPARALMLLVPLVILVAYVHVFFLNALLPEVLTSLNVAQTELLPTGGAVIFVSGLVLALASLWAPRLTNRIGERLAIPGGLIVSSVLIALLPIAPTFWTFLALRGLQVSILGPLLVLAMANATGWSGQTLGLANSARVAASAFGPIVATALVSWLPLHLVFALVAAVGLASAWPARRRWAGPTRDDTARP